MLATDNHFQSQRGFRGFHDNPSRFLRHRRLHEIATPDNFDKTLLLRGLRERKKKLNPRSPVF